MLSARVERERVDGVQRDGLGQAGHVVERTRATATAAVLVALIPARVVDEDAAHQRRRDREEMRAVLPVDVALAEQFEVGLADEGGRLQRADAPFARHVPRRR